MPAINGDCFQIKRTSTILQLPAVVTRTTHRRPHSLSTDAASTVALAACKCVRLICQKVGPNLPLHPPYHGHHSKGYASLGLPFQSSFLSLYYYSLHSKICVAFDFYINFDHLSYFKKLKL
jgi:hypothetical protein